MSSSLGQECPTKKSAVCVCVILCIDHSFYVIVGISAISFIILCMYMLKPTDNSSIISRSARSEAVAGQLTEIYTFMYIYKYTYTHVYSYIYIYIYIYTYIIYKHI